ncbi:MAG: glutaminyl-peptide cyclotransferase [Deltaproteobacteria bacterium]|nr:glutaminyl-peptide cyclotransferase [Deltaproteobacteria bacterium]
MMIYVRAGATAIDQAGGVPVYAYRIVNVYPHDPEAFTQGLIYCDGFLFESTGLRGRSTVRKIRLETGEAIRQRALEPQHFAEGLADWDGLLIQLTWKSNLGFIYDRNSLKMKNTFRYSGEGWGLTHDGRRLIMSDGSSILRFLDPRTLREIGRLPIKDGDIPIANLNELEFVKGEIYANVWLTDRIARISPDSGRVAGWIDLQGLLPASDRSADVDVLNGIAYDAQGDRLFVTGKLWPKLFEIKLIRRR